MAYLEFATGNDTQVLNIPADTDFTVGNDNLKLDDFRYYSRALTLTEITTLSTPIVLNQPPVATASLSVNKALKNKPVVVSLGYYDVDSDAATLCSVSNLDVNLEMLGSCSCSSGICSVILASSDASTKSFDYNVTANSDVSESVTASIEFLEESDINSDLIFHYDFEAPIHLGDNRHTTDGQFNAVVEGDVQFTQKNGGAADFTNGAQLRVRGYNGITGSDARGIAFWFNSKVNTNATMNLIEWGDQSGAGSNFRVYTLNQFIRFETTSNQRLNGDSRFLGDGNWHHIVLNFPNGSSTLGDFEVYIDGKRELVSGNTGSIVNTAGSSEVRIGSSGAKYMDEVRLYSRALTSEEIEVLSHPEASNIRPYLLGRTYPERLILNQSQTVYLAYSDPDEQQASSCSLSNLDPALLITSACSCSSGLCSVGLSSNTLGVVNFDYQVSTNENSNEISVGLNTINATTITDGLVAHYDFENNANLLEDATGNLDAVTLSGVSSFNDGTRGLVADMSGGGYIDLNNAASFYSQEIFNRTWSGHIKLNSISSQYIIDDRGRNSRGISVVLNANGTITASAGNTAGGQITATSVTALTPNTWYHFSVVYTAGSVYLYIDGQIEDGTTGGDFNIQNDDNSRSALGRRNNQSVLTASNEFDGLMDDIRVYNRGLGDHEILMLYLTD